MSQTSATPTEAANLAQLFLQRVEKSGDKEAFRIPENGDWTSVTWKQAAERVEPLAAGLLSLGVEPEDRIGIASTTRLEWILADLAILCAGAATTTVYPSTNAEDTAYILADSDSKIVFAEDDSSAQEAHRAARRAAESGQGRAVRRCRGRRLGHHPGRPRRPGREVSGRALLLRPQSRRRDQTRAAGDADLHLGHHRQAERCAAAPQGLGVRPAA